MEPSQQPLSFEEIVKNDRLVRVFLIEVNVILWGVTLALLFLEHEPLLIAIVLATASAFTFLMFRIENRRRRRRLVMGIVVESREMKYRTDLRIPYAPTASLIYRIYDVNILCDDKTNVRYFDKRRREIGERVLVLLDHQGRLLAVSAKDKPVSLDILRKAIGTSGQPI